MFGSSKGVSLHVPHQPAPRFFVLVSKAPRKSHQVRVEDQKNALTFGIVWPAEIWCKYRNLNENQIPNPQPTDSKHKKQQNTELGHLVMCLILHVHPYASY